MMDPVGVPRVTPAVPVPVSAPEAPAAAQPSPAPGQDSTRTAQAAGGTTGQAPAQEVSEAMDVLNESLRQTPFEARFSIDQDTRKVVIEFVDRQSGDVIRQFPSEEALRITRAIDKLQGLLVHQTA